MSEKLLIGKIRTDGGTQPRATISKDVVGEYVADMLDGAEFPPVTVFYDGESYWLADGFHRLSAYRRTGAHEVSAEIRMGTVRDAILHSVGANRAHGLRRTNADKRRAVMALLNDGEWSRWSNNQIAKKCAVSLDLVNRMRSSLNDSLSEKPTERTYTTKHGTEAIMNTKNIGRRSRDDGPEEDVKMELVLDEKNHRYDSEENIPDEGPEDDIDGEEEFVFDLTEDDDTKADDAIESLKGFFDMVLSEVVDADGQHYVITEMIKYLRQKSIEYHQKALVN